MKTRLPRKALSLFLSLVMMLSLLPTMALADGATEFDSTKAVATDQASFITACEYVFAYNGKTYENAVTLANDIVLTSDITVTVDGNMKFDGTGKLYCNGHTARFIKGEYYDSFVDVDATIPSGEYENVYYCQYGMDCPAGGRGSGHILCVDGVVVSPPAPALPVAEVTTYDLTSEADLAALASVVGQDGFPICDFSNGVSPSDSGLYTLQIPDCAYKFAATEEAGTSKYGNWYADYTVSFDQPVAKDSMGLVGYYGSWGIGLGFLAPQEVPANVEVPLLNTMMNSSNWTYDQIIQLVGEFYCGAFNLSSANNDTTMTVKLRIFDPEVFNDPDNIQNPGLYDEGENTYTIEEIQYKLTKNGAIPVGAVNYTVAGTADSVNPIPAGKYYISGGEMVKAEDAVTVTEKTAYFTDGKSVVVVDDDKEATVTTEQTSSINLKGAAEEVQAVAGQITAENTKVSGVELTTEGEDSGLQAIVNAALDTAQAEAIKAADELEVKVDVVVTPKAYTAENTLKFDLTPVATLVAKKNDATTATVNNIEVTNDMIDQTQNITVNIFSDFEPKTVLHVADNGETTSYTKGQTPSGSTFTYDTTAKKVTLIVHHFSNVLLFSEAKVAMIGETGYATLADALKGAESGDTITVLAGTYGAEQIGKLDEPGSHTNANLVRYKSLTIQPAEGATVKFTSDVSLGYDDSSTANATMTVKGFTFENASLSLSNYVQATVEDCTFSGNGNAAGALVINDSCCTNHKTTEEYPASQVTVKNCTIDGTDEGKPGIRLRNSGNVTLENNTVKNAKHNGILFESNGSIDNTPVKTISVTENKITEWNAGNTDGGGRAIRLAGGGLAVGSTVTITDNYFTKATLGKDEPDFIKIDGSKNATVNLDHNYWNNKILTAVNGENKLYTVDGATPTINTVISDATGVAKIDTVEYATLADAIAAAQNNNVIKLLSDIVLTENAGVTIPAGLTVTLDLNGKNLSNNLTADGASQVILNKGNLTIQDTSEGANGSISTLAAPDSIGDWHSSPRRNWATVAINNEGTFTLESGKIVSTAEGGIAYAIDNKSAGTLNINGGTVEALGKVEAIRMFINSATATNTVNISGGMVTGSGAVWMQACGGASPKGVLNITDGTLNTKTGYRIIGFEADDTGTTLNNVKVNVSGGSFTKGDSATSTGYPFETERNNNATFDPSYIELTGGTFHMDRYNDLINDKEGTLDDLCAEGYEVVPDDPSDGLFTVRKKSATYVAQNVTTGVEYETLQQAITAATSGDTIKLLADINYGSEERQGILIGSPKGSAVNKEITIDLNGKTYEGVFTYGAFIAQRGKLTIKDSSTEKTGVIRNNSNTNSATYAALCATNRGTIVLESGTVEGYAYGIYQYSVNNAAMGNTVIINGGEVEVEGYALGVFDYGTLKINGGKVTSKQGYAICNNGSDETDSTVIISGGEIYGDAEAIYHPGPGVCTISGGTLTGGETGIEMRAGTLNVTGGTITGNATPTNVTANGNGMTSSGAAIAVAQHTTKLPVSVNISGGTLKGYTPIYESNPEKNPAADIAKVTLNVTDGKFLCINEGTCVVYSEDCKGFITGGYYSNNVDETYIAYAYQTGLTKGTGEKTFGFGAAMSEVMFLTFCLRSLGYSDSGANPDFQWDKSDVLATSLGLISYRASAASVHHGIENAKGELDLAEDTTSGSQTVSVPTTTPTSANKTGFTRGDVVQIFWNALNTKLKGSTRTLADKLVSEGVFTQKAFLNATAIHDTGKALPETTPGTTSGATSGTTPCSHKSVYSNVTLNPTCEDKGERTYYCSDCGKELYKEDISRLGHNYEDGECTRCHAKDPAYVPPKEDKGYETPAIPM